METIETTCSACCELQERVKTQSKTISRLLDQVSQLTYELSIQRSYSTALHNMLEAGGRNES